MKKRARRLGSVPGTTTREHTHDGATSQAQEAWINPWTADHELIPSSTGLRAARSHAVRELPRYLRDLQTQVQRLPFLQLQCLYFIWLNRADGEENATPSDVTWSKMQILVATQLAAAGPNKSVGQIGVRDFGRVVRLIDQVMNAKRSLIHAEHLARGRSNPSREDWVRREMLDYELVRTGPAFRVHLLEETDELFRDINEPVSRVLGIAGPAIGQLLKGLEKLRASKALALLALADECVIRTDESSATGKADWIRLTRRLSLEASQFGTTTSDELSSAASSSLESAATFLELVSSGFGELNGPLDLVTIRLRPLARLGEGTYGVGLADDVVFGLRARIEQHLKGTPDAFNSYQSLRARYVEGKVLSSLVVALPGSIGRESLSYRFDDGDGERDYELDVLVQYGRVLFVVECKGGAASPAARRGAPRGLVEDLRSLIGDAHIQALRAYRFLTSAPVVQFHVANQPFEISAAQFDEIFLVSVTLDDLAFLGLRLSQLGLLGVVPVAESNRYVWSVTLHDLSAILEILEWPPQLIHYLRRRIPAYAYPVRLLDEVDGFSLYLREGFNFEPLRQAGFGAIVLGMSDLLSPYYSARLMRQIGSDVQVPEPYRMRMLPQYRAILNQMFGLPPTQYVDQVCRGLDTALENSLVPPAPPTRRDLQTKLAEIKRRTKYR